MSWAGNRSTARRAGSADIFLARTVVAVEGAGGDAWARPVQDLDEAIACLGDHLSAARVERPRSWRVWLGASLCRPVLLPTIPHALSAAEARRAEEAAAASMSGLGAPCRVWCEPRTAGAGRLAVVVEERALQALAALEPKLRLATIQPWWAEALRRALAQRPDLQSLAIWEGGALTMLAGAEGASFTVARCSLPVQDADAARSATLRASMSEGLDPAHALAIGLAFGGVPRPDAAPLPGLDGMPFGAYAFLLGGGA